ncbi:NAD(P)/FAD-dependent oxidoreductase [Agromyces sp. NPDC049794]|uniref:NAD(P)/FAD-dependent oxidoreductase n=1 Tax=unclassified Agromyces TaxID=2639701 RepID=UPI0033D617BF
MQRTDWDVIIVGGGSAGLSAALMLGRSRRRVLVVDGGEPRNRFSEHMHGVIGHDHSSPLDLLAAGRAELTRYEDVVIESGTVVSAAPLDTDTDAIGFEVELEAGERHTARRMLLATGLRDELPDIPGLAEQWGRTAALCPYCDGWEVRDRRIAVIATAGNTHQAQLMRQLSPHVTFYSQGANLSAAARAGLEARDVAIESRAVVEVVSDETGGLRGIRLDDGTELEADAIFVAPRPVPNDHLLRELRARTIRQDGVDWVLVDPSGRTNVRGLWAAGNIATAQSSVPVAMAAGNLAGSGINGELVEEDVREAVAAHERENG